MLIDTSRADLAGKLPLMLAAPGGPVRLSARRAGALRGQIGIMAAIQAVLLAKRLTRNRDWGDGAAARTTGLLARRVFRDLQQGVTLGAEKLDHRCDWVKEACFEIRLS